MTEETGQKVASAAGRMLQMTDAELINYAATHAATVRKVAASALTQAPDTSPPGRPDMTPDPLKPLAIDSAETLMDRLTTLRKTDRPAAQQEAEHEAAEAAAELASTAVVALASIADSLATIARKH